MIEGADTRAPAAVPALAAGAVPARRRWPSWGELSLRAVAGLTALFLGLPVVVLVLRAFAENAFAIALTSQAVLDALWLSLLTTSFSLVLTVALGLPLAIVLARRAFRGKAWIETLVDLPIVLPPSVAGIALLFAFGRRGVFGDALFAFGIAIPFTTIAVVLAQTFVSMPFFIRSARSGIAGVDRDLEDAARVDGAAERQLFRWITIPLASSALAAGLVLSWARALGEFGATIMFAGNLEGSTQTLPLLVYSEFQGRAWRRRSRPPDPHPRGVRRADRGPRLPLGPGARHPVAVLTIVRHHAEATRRPRDQLADRPAGPAARSHGGPTVKISARNQLAGTVKSVTEGAVMAEVVVEVDGGHESSRRSPPSRSAASACRPARASSPSSSRPRSCSPSRTEPWIRRVRPDRRHPDAVPRDRGDADPGGGRRGHPWHDRARSGVRGGARRPGWLRHLILLYHLHEIRAARLTVTPFLDDRTHGIFATRSPARPNAIGLSTVRLVAVRGATLEIEDVDMLDGSPLLDIKPYVPAFDDRADARIGWFAGCVERVDIVRSDERFGDEG